MKKKFIKIAKCLPMIFMMVIIFVFSSQNGETSGGLSYSIAEFISETLSYLKITVTPDSIHLLIRKCAHMTEFAILYFTVLLALSDFKISKNMLLAFFITVIYAASDELHQFFVSGRCGTIIDVFIDGTGALIAFVFTVLVKNKGSK